jgi:HlyD family secretion protein
VDEADIGCIRPGQPVRFTINACWERLFEGKVAQIRMHPTKQQDEITYTVVVAADHFGNVLPEMSANLQFEIERHRNVLLIPNDALEPPALADVSTSPAEATDEPAGLKTVAPTEASPARSAAKLWKQRKANHHLWVKEGDLVRPIEVQLGSSNGLLTEILSSNVKEGTEVILGEVCMKGGR